MTQLQLKLKLITPLLMFGAFNGAHHDPHPAQPEIRAASIRGGLRYWLRTVYGAAYGSNITGLYEAESRIFGSTSRGSAVTVRVQHDLKKVDFDPNERYDRHDPRRNNALRVLPERFGFAGFQQATTSSDQSFWLTLVSHPSRRDVFTSAFSSALLLAFTLGGFGKRARRGGGALQIVNQPDDDLPDILRPPNVIDGGALAAELTKRFSEIQQVINKLPDLHDEKGNILQKRPYRANSIPDYPVFASDHCCVFIGTKGKSNYLAALKQMWSITGPYHRVQAIDREGRPVFRQNRRGQQEPVLDRWAWGYVRGSERRASALHMRVYQCSDEKYYPIITIFRGGRHDEKWDRVQEVIDLFDDPKYKFLRVYGSRVKWT